MRVLAGHVLALRRATDVVVKLPLNPLGFGPLVVSGAEPWVSVKDEGAESRERR